MSRRSPSRARRFLSRLLALALIGWVVCVLAIVGWSTRNSSGTADAIVVLGAAQYSGRPSPVLQARLDHALKLWDGHRAPRIVFTGGRREGDVISEAAAGRRFAMKRGVPSQSILMEASGRTTLASMHGAAVVLSTRKDSLSMPMKPRVLLVSDPFHMLRLDVLARLHGLTPLPSPTRTSPISARRLVALEYMVRESFALPADVVVMLWLHLTGHSAEPVADG